MRIHTTVSENVIREAARAADAGLTVSRHGSRKSDHAFEVKLTGASKRRPMGDSENFAATWDQWGIFLSVIFAADSESSCWAYTDGEDFNFQTNWRFETPLTDAHGDHKWIILSRPWSESASACTKCSAVKRWN